MKIQVQLFSFLRSCLPPGTERGKAMVELPDGATLADLVSRLGIDRMLGYEAADLVSRSAWQVMVSGRYEADMSRVLQDGDQVGIFPPISGG
jgi:molybdopterin converting factor small subunit